MNNWANQNGQTGTAPGRHGSRVRVRTPGKHIVLAVVVAALMLSVSTSFLRFDNGRPYAERLRTVVNGDGTAVRLEPFLVDLAPDPLGQVAFMRLSAMLVTDDPAVEQAVMIHNSAIRERMMFLFRRLTPEDFDSTEDQERLKEELLRRVNLVLAPHQIREVVIHDLIIQ